MLEKLRTRILTIGSDVTSGERGALLALLGSVERSELLIKRIDAERKSVNRAQILAKARMENENSNGQYISGFKPMPAE